MVSKLEVFFIVCFVRATDFNTTMLSGPHTFRYIDSLIARQGTNADFESNRQAHGYERKNSGSKNKVGGTERSPVHVMQVS